MATNGEVDFSVASNDGRGDKGSVGMGLPITNDRRGVGGMAGGQINNDRRGDMPSTGSVESIIKARPVG